MTTLLGAVMCLMATSCVTAVSVTPTPSAAPSAAPTTDVCRTIDLQDPSGQRVDLTGTWRTPGGGGLTYYALQDGDCVWITGGFLPADDDRGFRTLGEFTLLFSGRLRSDFTVSGQWAYLEYVSGGGSEGSSTGPGGWTLDVGEPMTLQPFDPGGYSPTLIKISDRYVES